VTIFDHDSYKAFFLDWLHSQPKRGHGLLRKLAQVLRVHTTMLTHIFRGDSHLTIDQALTLARYVGLDEIETDYFMNLVQSERAASVECKRYFEAKIKLLRSKAVQLKERLGPKTELSEMDRARFYSDWTYSAANLLPAIEQFRTAPAIAEFLRISLPEAHKILQFLVAKGLSDEKNGKYGIGPVQTFLGKESPYTRPYLKSWRLRAMEQLHDQREEEVSFTNPVVISHADFDKVRELIISSIKQFSKISGPSPCEVLCCLNIDWVKVR